jgi:hypothetical protein
MSGFGAKTVANPLQRPPHTVPPRVDTLSKAVSQSRPGSHCWTLAGSQGIVGEIAETTGDEARQARRLTRCQMGSGDTPVTPPETQDDITGLVVPRCPKSGPVAVGDQLATVLVQRVNLGQRRLLFDQMKLPLRGG